MKLLKDALYDALHRRVTSLNIADRGVPLALTPARRVLVITLDWPEPFGLVVRDEYTAMTVLEDTLAQIV